MNVLMQVINFLLGRKSLGQIAAGFDKTVNDLHDLRLRNGEAIQKNYRTIEKKQAQNLELAAENLKAAKFQQNLEALLGNT